MVSSNDYCRKKVGGPLKLAGLILGSGIVIGGGTVLGGQAVAKKIGKKLDEKREKQSRRLFIEFTPKERVMKGFCFL